MRIFLFSPEYKSDIILAKRNIPLFDPAILRCLKLRSLLNTYWKYLYVAQQKSKFLKNQILGIFTYVGIKTFWNVKGRKCTKQMMFFKFISYTKGTTLAMEL